MKFYRYEAVEYGSIDGDYIFSAVLSPKLVLYTYNLWKETPKGYWIGIGVPFNKEEISRLGRWVSKTAKKRYAYPSKEEALVNFIKRTERRIEILTHQLEVCKISIDVAKQMASVRNIPDVLSQK